MEISYYQSPIGTLEIICCENELMSLKISDSRRRCNKDSDVIQHIKLQLDEYFSKDRQEFDIKINPEGTSFQKRVWQELQSIPYGETKNYSDIAKGIGQVNASRAVGNACNRNPIMIIIPCHRVIAKNGKLGGFVYGNIIKAKLLAHENT